MAVSWCLLVNMSNYESGAIKDTRGAMFRYFKCAPRCDHGWLHSARLILGALENRVEGNAELL